MATVAVAEFPVHDPEEPLALPVTLPVKAPTKPPVDVVIPVTSKSVSYTHLTLPTKRIV